jgi:hypothetical protein
VSRVVDRGAIVAAYVGIGMAAVIGISFLLVIPIPIVYALFSLPAGLLIGYYADSRAGRQAGPWSRIVANGLFAGLVTAVSLAVLLLAVDALFFYADDGYRDQSAGPRLQCEPGPACVYARYIANGQGADLEREGVTDVSTFTGFYWSQQAGIAGTIFLLTAAGSLGGALLFGVVRPRNAGQMRSAEMPAGRR